MVIGVGNRHRHDDAVGLDVAARVASRLGDRARVVAFDGESTGLLDLWADAALVVLVDAVASGGPAGRVRRFEGDLGALPVGPPTSSTHGLGLAEVWRLGSALGQLPERAVLFGIEGQDFAPGIGLTPEVARSVDAVVGLVAAELAEVGPSARGAPHDA
jgi:hydrogenase maturation protease